MQTAQRKRQQKTRSAGRQLWSATETTSKYMAAEGKGWEIPGNASVNVSLKVRGSLWNAIAVPWLQGPIRDTGAMDWWQIILLDKVKFGQTNKTYLIEVPSEKEIDYF